MESIIVEPRADYECIKFLLSKTFKEDEIKELVIIPQDRIGFSGANLYLYYYKSKSIPTMYSIPHFFKVGTNTDAGEMIKKEVIAFNQHVVSYLDNAQNINGPYSTHINNKKYTFISSPAVGSKAKRVTLSDFEDLSAITIESFLKKKDLIFSEGKHDIFLDKIIKALQYLFDKICKPWIGMYDNFVPTERREDKELLKEFNWKTEYEWYLRWEKSKDELVKLLESNHQHEYIELNGIKYINPLNFIEHKILDDCFSGKCRVVHGDLHLRNVMVNKSLEENEVYIIDFGWTNKDSHCLKDYCLLESSLKFIHLSKELKDDEIIEFEKALLREKFPSKFEDKKNARFIFNIILEIRNLSKKECQKEFWKQEYLTSLLLITTGQLGIKDFQGLDKRAILISVTWISHKLHLWESSEKVLSDLGETAILDEIILNKFNKELKDYENIVIPLGDDCAGIQISNSNNVLITSTDPCPLPVAWLLGDRDYYHYGWYSMLINLSDIASMGARPIGILMSCIMNESMSLSEFNRFIEGASDCSKRYLCPVIGGNIKDGKSFSVNGTIVGEIAKDNILKRTGASDGDFVVVIGDLGLFWTAVLAIKYYEDQYDNDKLNLFWDKVRKPFPKISAGLLLAELNEHTSCMDNSDGLTGCFYELSKKNNLDLIIEENNVIENLDPDTVDIAKKFKIDPLKLGFNWGDWQLVCTIPQNKYSYFEDVIAEHNYSCSNKEVLMRDSIKYSKIGRLTKPKKIDKPMVLIESSEGTMVLNNYENERFSDISIFSHGLDNYISILKDFTLKNSL